MSFGTKLKLCRSALGLSQQQLADLVGSTKQIVSLYEKDERIPKVTTAAKYADAVKVPLKYLITDSIPINLWEADDLLEDYWRASPADRLKIVVRRGIDPRIALDYERVSALAQLAKKEKNAALPGDGLSGDELKLVGIYRSITGQGQQEMMAHAEYIGERYKKNPSASTGKVV